MVECLHVLAGAACAEGLPRRAATLAGAAEELHAAIGAPPSPAERAVAERFESSLRTHADEDIAAARRAGEAMALDRVLDYALDPVRAC